MTREMMPWGLLIVGVLLLTGLYLATRPKVATGPTGGVTSPENPVSDAAASNSSSGSTDSTSPTLQYTAGSTTPPPLPKLVKTIMIRKDVSAVTDLSDRVLQIAEIKVYDKNGLLDKSAFSDISYGSGITGRMPGQANYPVTNLIDGNLNTFTFSYSPTLPVHTILLTLKDPANVTSIEVYNRGTFRPDRLAGVTVQLNDESGNVLWVSSMLTGQTEVQVLNPVYESGFTSKKPSLRNLLPSILRK